METGEREREGERADGAWKRDAPPGEYQIGGERPRRLSLPRSEAPESFKKKRGTTESITPTPTERMRRPRQVFLLFVSPPLPNHLRAVNV